MADRISDAVLDAVLDKDDTARVACETLVTTGMAFIAGEISTRRAYVHMPDLVRSTIRDIGYTDANFGFDYETVRCHDLPLTSSRPTLRRALTQAGRAIRA